MTVLSAYFDIGIIPAGFGVSRKDPALYVNYTSIYSAILEPVIFITDHIQTADKITEIRADLPTQVRAARKMNCKCMPSCSLGE